MFPIQQTKTLHHGVSFKATEADNTLQSSQGRYLGSMTTWIWFWKMSLNCMQWSLIPTPDDPNVRSSDYTGTQTKLPKLLLNGNNICMVRLVGFTARGWLLTFDSWYLAEKDLLLPHLENWEPEIWIFSIYLQHTEISKSLKPAWHVRSVQKIAMLSQVFEFLEALLQRPLASHFLVNVLKEDKRLHFEGVWSNNSADSVL